MRYLYLLATALAVVSAQIASTVVSAQIGTAACPTPRIRRAWSQYCQADKDLYIKAVSLGMKRGYHHRFVEIHIEPASNSEAHEGFFFYWHRAYLLAYENMLRSLGPQFACITLPYWDYASLGANFISGECTDMLNCGPLLKDFGGSLPQAAKGPYTLTVNGQVFQADNCVVSPLTRNFCQNSTAFNSNKCFNCMPRNDWSKAAVPPDVNALSIYNNVLGDVPPNLDGVTSGVQWGTHNMVHAVLDSTMGTFASPSDPVFYAHHATTDALHAIYYNCVVGGVPPKNPYDDDRTWTTTRNFAGKTIVPSDLITMKVGEAGTVPASIWTATSNPIYPFFQGIPQTYLPYADTTKLGAYSYKYNFTGTMLEGMNKQCTAFKPAGAVLLTTDGGRPSAAATKESMWLRDATILASNYYTEDSDITHQVQMMLCVYYNECLGGVFDYSDEFKTNFHVSKKPPCKRIVDDLAGGNTVIGVPGWERTMLKTYPCNGASALFL
ncbi:hypothetical protein SPRG_12325 [Saprolegnia parasitica CBS 223.65]|uniref:Tyrosinase copper-binding domain-containing protein n=1 Tax=Saprolegnia parasitica (strain CBS 223.65) TaxID=695850 RepID=A0A067BUS0_SAPPC|nr:hypothetical protein SPRG_12325 [Saprolegnia parasitica CBS 223.65]KDO22239.1 hypothetical protein SPRG_12325 [Saprolegnia parasitica CBS 223.65]|eukprot:XP_012207076.1 hypothetical protein SPRG_12325 [Saprolegnia parasitica CBS 223.65]